MISVIVPIYKVEKYVNQCVDSIINQTYKNLEIILVDDGSPDNCPNICDDYARADSRIKVVHKKNGGLMSARQAGLKAATGDYVGFVDGDDYIKENMYEKFADAIEKYNPDMALCEFWFSYPDKNEGSSQKLTRQYFNKPQLEKEVYPTMLFKDKFYSFGINPCCWSKVFKKKLLEDNLYKVTPEIKIGEDAAFTYPCLLDADSIAYIDDYLYYYRINPQSMTKSYDENYHNTILIPYDILKEKFSEYDSEILNQLNYFLIYLFNGVVRNEASPKSQKSLKEKLDIYKMFISGSDIVSAVKGIDKSVLPIHTKLLAAFISIRSPLLINFYGLLIRSFL